MRYLACCLLLVSVGVVAACSGASSSSGVGTGGSGNGTGTGGGGGLILTGGSGGGSGGLGDKLNQTPPCNQTNPGVDGDGDGFTPGQGDCNDCTQQMNPGAYDYVANGVDEDCNGTPDDEPLGCDTQTYDVGYGDPEVAARAIGLCRSDRHVVGPGQREVRQGRQPGMADLSHEFATFGPNVTPREGANVPRSRARRASDRSWLWRRACGAPLLDQGA
jgi:hypothetical protein